MASATLARMLVTCCGIVVLITILGTFEVSPDGEKEIGVRERERERERKREREIVRSKACLNLSVQHA